MIIFFNKKIGFFFFNFRNSHSNETSLFQIIRTDMKLANEDVSMLAFTSEQITAPFLLAEMVYCIVFIHYVIPQNVSCWCAIFFFQVERVASMLNYFLLQLVGPQRKSLSLKDPEKYEFRPKQLLKQVHIKISISFFFEFACLNCQDRKGVPKYT